MSMCARPAVEVQSIAGRDIARCTTCSAISPPYDIHAWIARHRSEAVVANCEIGDKGRAA